MAKAAPPRAAAADLDGHAVMHGLHERHEADLGRNEGRGNAAEDARGGRRVGGSDSAAESGGVELRDVYAGDGGCQGSQGVKPAEARCFCSAEAACNLWQEVLPITQCDEVKEI